MSLFNAILPVLTLVLGFGSNYALERHRDHQTEHPDQQRRAADREDVRTEYYDASKATTAAIAARVKQLHRLAVPSPGSV